MKRTMKGWCLSMDETLTKMIDDEFKHNLEFAKSTFLSTGSLWPMAIGVSEERDHYVIGLDFKDDRSKARSVFMAKAMFRAHKVVRIYFMCECWYTVKTKDEIDKGVLRPRMDPKRMEGIIVSLVSKETHKSAGLPIIRLKTKDGEKVDIGPAMLRDSTESEDNLWGDYFNG